MNRNGSEIPFLIFKCLCNVNGYTDRRDALVPDEISQEDFEKYVDWWWRDPRGVSTYESMADAIKESINEFWPLSQEDSLDVFYEEFGNWEDFLRELQDCNLQALYPNSAGNGNTYFTEYVILNSMRIESGEQEFSKNHEIIVNLLEEWFENSYQEVDYIFSCQRALISHLFAK